MASLSDCPLIDMSFRDLTTHTGAKMPYLESRRQRKQRRKKRFLYEFRYGMSPLDSKRPQRCLARVCLAHTNNRRTPAVCSYCLLYTQFDLAASNRQSLSATEEWVGFASTSSLKNAEGFEARNVPGGLDQEGGGDPQKGLKISQARVFVS